MKLCHPKHNPKPPEIQQMFSSLHHTECGNSSYHTSVSLHPHYRIWYDRTICAEIKSAVTIEREMFKLKSIDFRAAHVFVQTSHQKVTLQLKD